MRGSGARAAYNALNLKFQTQNLHNTGLSMVANYTWAHSLDDMSSTFDDSLQGLSSPAGFGNLGLHQSSSTRSWIGAARTIDVRNRFVVSPIWETPWYKNGKSVPRQVLGRLVTGGHLYRAHRHAVQRFRR